MSTKSEVDPKPILTCLHAFSRAWRRRHVFAQKKKNEKKEMEELNPLLLTDQSDPERLDLVFFYIIVPLSL